jgi:hypothetical protein
MSRMLPAHHSNGTTGLAYDSLEETRNIITSNSRDIIESDTFSNVAERFKLSIGKVTRLCHSQPAITNSYNRGRRRLDLNTEGTESEPEETYYRMDMIIIAVESKLRDEILLEHQAFEMSMTMVLTLMEVASHFVCPPR